MMAEQLKALEEFKAEHKPRVPVYAYREAIVDLRNNGYSLSQINIFLLEKFKIKTSEKTLTRILSTSPKEKVQNKLVAQYEPKQEELAQSKIAAFFPNRNKEA